MVSATCHSGGVRVAILGALLVADDAGRPVEVGGARLRALLTRLALEPGRAVGVDALVEDLWGDTPPADRLNALQSSSTAAYWPVSPTRRRTAPASRTTSRPPTRATPASGRSSVASTRTAVVLPAPFGPSTPSTVPGRTARSTPASAVVVPNRLTSPSASIAFTGQLLSRRGRGSPRALAGRAHPAGSRCQRCLSH
jgi:hypothetical protein